MDNQLTHYGVLGMKWGVRKARRSSSSSKPKNYSEDYKKAKTIKKKHVSEMSNEELRALTQRLQLEKQYKDLNPNAVNRGKNEVAQILKNSAKQTVTNLVAKNMTKAVETAIKQATRGSGK